MKNRYHHQIWLGVLFLLCLTSCNDWLDVRPKSQVKEDQLFSTAQGFRDALLGVYTIMASTDAYGANGTMGFMDVLAQNYTTVGSNFSDVMAYNYSSDQVKDASSAMWKKYYNGVVNCNYLLKNLEENGSVLPDSTRNLIHGEALAARSYLLFDLLRTFAPSYKAGAGKAGVPYVNTVTSAPVQPGTVAEELDQLVRDLLQARDYLKDIDPLGPAHATYNDKYKYTSNDYVQDEGFWLYRYARMNYYAITAELARVSLYKEDNAAALQYAQEVINSGKFSFMPSSVSSDESNYLPYMTSVARREYISSVYVYNLKAGINDNYFRDSQSSTLTISDGRKQEVFTAEGLDLDIRAKRFFGIPSGSTKEYCMKYATGNNIPLLKLGEMYLIAAEASGDISYINQLRRQRGYTTDLPAGIDLRTALTGEYQREFIAEGQLFYYYKRLNLATIPYATVDAAQAYILPEPDEEIEFGYTE